jgi:hypothetical protein
LGVRQQRALLQHRFQLVRATASTPSSQISAASGPVAESSPGPDTSLDLPDAPATWSTTWCG